MVHVGQFQPSACATDTVFSPGTTGRGVPQAEQIVRAEALLIVHVKQLQAPSAGKPDDSVPSAAGPGD